MWKEWNNNMIDLIAISIGLPYNNTLLVLVTRSSQRSRKAGDVRNHVYLVTSELTYSWRRQHSRTAGDVRAHAQLVTSALTYSWWRQRSRTTGDVRAHVQLVTSIDEIIISINEY